MILSDLPSLAEAGFAKAGNRCPPPGSSPGAGFFGIMRKRSCVGDEFHQRAVGIAKVDAGARPLGAEPPQRTVLDGDTAAFEMGHGGSHSNSGRNNRACRGLCMSWRPSRTPSTISVRP